MKALASFEVRQLCRICQHPVVRVATMLSGPCRYSGCDDRGWHYHCEQHHDVCTTAGCWPADPEAS